MTRNHFRYLHASGLSLALCISTIGNPLQADDTEIYTAALDGGFSPEVRPNILYIVDTSGSMEGRFDFDPSEWHEAPYDPNITYPGPCNPGRYYFKSISDSERDSNGPILGTHGYPINEDGNFNMPSCNSSSFPAAAMHCDTAWDNFDTKGWHFDRWGVFTENTDEDGIMTYLWKKLSQGNSAWSSPRECDGDWGIHGEVAGPPDAVYPSRTEEGWVNDEFHDDVQRLALQRYVVANGNLMNWFSVQTRLGVTQVALRNVIRNLEDVNVGLMRFDSSASPGGGNNSSSDGGVMIKEFGLASEAGHKEALIDALMNIAPYDLKAATPLAETLLEALYVFSGSHVYWGDSSEGDDGQPFHSVAASRRADNQNYYRSPITESCQQNSIIYMTDGASDSDDSTFDGNSDVNSEVHWTGGFKYIAVTGGPGLSSMPVPDNYLVPFVRPDSDDTDTEPDVYHCNDDSNYCLPSIANYLRHVDVAPHVTGTQNVTVHTIGFNADGGSGGDRPEPDLLQLAAEKGGGTFSFVTSAADLEEAFRVTTRKAVIGNTAFTAPALAVNAFNRTRDENRVYLAMFKSSTSPGWGGNLKAYQFGSVDGNIVITDAAGKPAVDPESGQFHFDARSIWSAVADGNAAPAGGAASRLPATRNIYTWFGDNSRKLLRTEDYEFTTDNTSITPALLGMNGTETFPREMLISWLRGVDVLDEDGDGSTIDQRLHIGDPLHSRPTVVTYGGTEDTPHQRVFLTTNDGFLHVIDPSNGTETFAFVAEETLRNAKRIFVGATDDEEMSGGEGKAYGLDGVPVLHVDEGGSDDPGVSGDDKVHLYTGMRRGGRNYYAFDFTDPDNPEILWRIQGGDLNGNNEEDFDEKFYRLGYTYSSPRVGQIKIDGNVRKILVFGGGYDLGQDFPAGVGSTRDSYRADAYGNALYIVDALTGTRLWWAGPEGSGATLEIDEMVNSIPSDVALIDADNDGWSDRIYVGDTGGRVFRIDLQEFSTGGTIQSWGGMIADLGASNVDPVTDVQHNRKFFYAPDVSMVENGVNDYLAIAIGSGNRAHPSYPIGSDTATQDVFFVLKDPNILNRPSDYDYGIVFDDDILFDVGANGLVSDDAALNASKGWYLAMTHAGEKILAESTTFNYTVTFTSFEPEDIDLSTCQARTGIGRLYALNLRNGNPVYNFDGDEDTTAADRSYILVRDGIPPAPTIAFPDENDGAPIMMVGPELPPLDPGGNLRRSYWMIPESEE